jgi:hypothetical protein
MSKMFALVVRQLSASEYLGDSPFVARSGKNPSDDSQLIIREPLDLFPPRSLVRAYSVAAEPGAAVGSRGRSDTRRRFRDGSDIA